MAPCRGAGGRGFESSSTTGFSPLKICGFYKAMMLQTLNE